MAALTRVEFNSFIESTLPDNSNREISAFDLRNSFFTLADSIDTFNQLSITNTVNVSDFDRQSTKLGLSSIARVGVRGFSSVANTAVGYGSLELAYTTARNTAVGNYAASCNTLGSDNLALGVHSLGSITTGSGNIGVGNYSLMENKHGNFNIAIGHGAGYISPTTESFKFYLGSYPEASGDCDSYVAGLDKPPLLYGDLQTLQLAIGASGFRGAEKLAVSGHVIPYESGGIFSLGSGVYRWDAHLQNLFVSGNIETANPIFTFRISDGVNPSDPIQDNEIIYTTGISGIDTVYDSSSNTMRISAQPISGYLSNEMNLTSGLSPAFGGPSGLIWNVSGWAGAYADAVAAIAGLYTHWRIEDQSSIGENITDPSTTENTLTIAGVSGAVTNYRLDTNTLEISTQPLSGILHGIIGASGDKTRQLYLQADIDRHILSSARDSAISGTFMSLSGIEPAFGGPSGLIWNVSGWADANIDYNDLRSSGLIDHISGVLFRIVNASGNYNKDYTDQAILNANAFTHWTLSDQTQSTQIDSTNTLNIDAVSGILAEVIDIEAAPVLRFSAKPISGVLQPQIITNDQRASGLIDHVSGVLNRHILSTSGSLDGYVFDTSGIFRTEIANIIEPENGTIDSRITTYDVNTAKPYVDGLIDPIYTPAGLSGTLQYDIDTSDANASGLISFTSGVLDRFVDDASGVFNYDFYDPQGRLALVSGYNSRYTEIVVGKLSKEILEGYKGAWKAGDQTGTNVARINFEDILDFQGLDGITTTIETTNNGDDFSTVSHRMFINATPISGYLEGIASMISGSEGLIELKINSVSGLIDINDSRASGLIAFTSGVAREAVGASGALISGWAHDSFLNYDDRASGLLDHLSGILRVGISDSGYYFDNRASGVISHTSGVLDAYIDTVSGWVLEHVEDEIIALDLLNDNYSYWQISDGTTSRRIGSLRETQFLGISGIETSVKTTGASGLFISARPLEERASGLIETNNVRTSGLIEHASGILHRIVDASGNKIVTELNTYLKTAYYAEYVQEYANIRDTVYDTNASGLIDFVSGVLDRYVDVTSGVLRYGIDASGATISGWAHDSFISYDQRASGLIDHVSGILQITPGSGLTRVEHNGINYIHTDGSGNFEKIILRKTGASLLDPVGQLVSTTEDGRNNVINASGYLQIPAVQEHYDLPDPHTVGDSGVYFADSHIYQSNGSSWSKPTIIEGFMSEVDPPTDYLSETSGKIVTRVSNNGIFQTGPEEYIINRDHTFAASGGYYLMAMRVNNEYRPVWSTCSGCPSCE
jgi:hypothetical protein